MSSTAEVRTDKPVGPRSAKGVRTRARLVAAAKQVFEETGFLEARISDIVERAGLSHGSFYHYFDSKEQIFREVAESVYDELSAPLSDVILAPSSSGISPQDRLREALRQHFESYRAEARIMGLIEQVSRYDRHINALLRARHRRYSDQIADSIRRLQRHGLADPALDPVLAAAAVGALTGRFAELWLVEGDLDCTQDDATEQLARMLANALQLERAASTSRGGCFRS